ncbi:MAG: phosphate ABC transporter substrate-binding protein [bacterium]|nr:phosphate ABC transporter substrate-binding protein [bacterium]
MKRFKLSALVIISIMSAGLLSACNQSTADTSADNDSSAVTGKLVLAGSSTVAPLAQEIGQRFEQEHPNVRVDVQTGGSSRGISDARSGLADIGMASRALKEDERDLTAHTIALDGICVILHADNPVESLSDDQVRAIYRGQLTNWNEVGGQDAPITVVNKAEGRSTLELFLHYYGMESTEVEASVVIGDNEQGIKTVSTNPASIGYVSIGAAEFAAEDGVSIKLLPMDGVAPTTQNVRNGSFPLSRPLNLITQGDVDGLSRTFIDYAQSSEVNDLITGLYFVPTQ